jgi:methylmalonyl-CoA carboxyltransferase 5S subunit
VMTGEFADLMLGYYGSTLGEKDPEVLKKAGEQAKKPPITCRPADLLKPEWEALRTAALALPGCNGTDEDVLTHAMFPQVAPKCFKARADGPKNLGKEPQKKSDVPPAAASKADGKANGGAALNGSVNYVITLNGREHKVTVAPGN